jgi:hypothetical protein
MAWDWQPDLANWAMYTPWPFTPLFQELGDKVEIFDFREVQFRHADHEARGHGPRELLDRVMNNYRRFYMQKALFHYPWRGTGFRRRYLLGCLKAFLKAGFERTFYDLGKANTGGRNRRRPGATSWKIASPVRFADCCRTCRRGLRRGLCSRRSAPMPGPSREMPGSRLRRVTRQSSRSAQIRSPSPAAPGTGACSKRCFPGFLESPSMLIIRPCSMASHAIASWFAGTSDPAVPRARPDR